MKQERYYLAYEERYRSVYKQGLSYWTADPEELAAVKREVATFLAHFGIEPGPAAHVVELGCGEGYLGECLAEAGYRYTGIDVAESAIRKAAQRLAPLADRARAQVGDLLDSATLPAAAFDAGVDVRCLHMLVLDAHRQSYISNARRALKPGAPMLFVGQSHREDAPGIWVESYEQWMQLAGGDYKSTEERDAWQDGRAVKVRVPRLPARPRSEAQYRTELEAAGFELAWARPEGTAITFAALAVAGATTDNIQLTTRTG